MISLSVLAPIRFAEAMPGGSDGGSGGAAVGVRAGGVAVVAGQVGQHRVQDARVDGRGGLVVQVDNAVVGGHTGLPGRTCGCRRRCPRRCTVAEIGGGCSQAGPPAMGVAGGDHEGVIKPAADAMGDDRCEVVVVLPELLVSAFGEPRFSGGSLFAGRRRPLVEVAGVGEDVCGDPASRRYRRCVLSVGCRVGSHVQVGPPQVRVGGPVDFGGDGDLRRYSAAGEVGDVVAGSERLDGEGPGPACGSRSMRSTAVRRLVNRLVGSIRMTARPASSNPAALDAASARGKVLPPL